MGFEEYEAIGRAIASTGGTLDDVLEHYGIPGMKWGRRRSRKEIDTAHDAPDHIRARQLHTVAKTHGVRRLNNDDLNELNKRLNLEQNYGNLTSKTKQKTSVATGAKWVGGKVMKLGDMALDEVAKAHIRVQLHQKGLLPQINNGKG